MKRITFRAGDYVEPLPIGSSLLLGNFDGVHRGHQELVKKALENSKKAAVLLFDGFPSAFLKRKSSLCLTSLEERIEIFSKMGVSFAYVLHLDEKLFSLSKEGFMSKVLDVISPSLIVIGADYSFGKGAEGRVSDLEKKYKVLSLPLLNGVEGKISTQSIIKMIEEGKIEAANDDLGRPYRISGKVVKGLSNGRKIGYRTANLKLLTPYVIPKSGVYKGKAIVKGMSYNSLINVGTNPTIGRLSTDSIEAHLLGFNENIYGEDVKLEFLSYIREEKLFSSLDDLRKQLDIDIKILNN